MEKQRLRVLHIINNLKREGAQVMVSNLVTANLPGRARYFVYAREPKGSLQKDMEGKGIGIHVPDVYLNARNSARSLKYISQIVEKEHIDLVHAHMADAAFLGWLAAKKSGLPLVITHHGDDILPKCGRMCRAVYNVLLALASRYARQNIAVSSSVEACVRRRLLLGSKNVRVIPNGVPVPSDEDISPESGNNPYEPRIVVVGRLVELKGQDQLIAAASRLVGRFPSARFYIVGDGPRHEVLLQQVRSLGLSDNVILTGAVKDVSVYLRNAHIFVSTSFAEGMPLATLEAMAWEVPVVVTDIPGNRNVVEPGVNGSVYEAGNPDALARTIEDTLDNSAQSRQLAKTAREMVKDRFSAKAMAGVYEDLYAEILADRGAGINPATNGR